MTCSAFSFSSDSSSSASGGPPAPSPRAGACRRWAAAPPVARQAHHDLRRGAHQRLVADLEKERVGRRVQQPQRAVQLRRRACRAALKRWLRTTWMMSPSQMYRRARSTMRIGRGEHGLYRGDRGAGLRVQFRRRTRIAPRVRADHDAAGVPHVVEHDHAVGLQEAAARTDVARRLGRRHALELAHGFVAEISDDARRRNAAGPRPARRAGRDRARATRRWPRRRWRHARRRARARGPRPRSNSAPRSRRPPCSRGGKRSGGRQTVRAR
jgi:hypothetical protein